MEQHVSNAQDVNGNALRGATITVLDSLGVPASLFSDNGVTPKANPFLSDASGEFAFYAADGKYTVTIAAVGYTTETRAGITLFDPSAPLLPADLTVAGNLQVNGNTTLGNAPSDTLSVASNAVTWANPTHSGQHTFSGNLIVQGNTTLGDADSDSLTVAPSAVTWSGNPTHSGSHTFSGDVATQGNTTIGNAGSDTLTVSPSAVTWVNNPTHSGNHVFSGNVTTQGVTTIGDAAGDGLTVNSSAVTWANNPTHSGNHVFSGNWSVQGNSTLGDAAGDSLTVNPSAVSWPNNPTHSGNHTFSTGVRVGNTNIAGVTVLDYYEEGTFTPELRFGSSNTGITYGSRAGVYTRIGNRVDFYIDFTLTSKGVQVGNATVSGLYVGGLTVQNGGGSLGLYTVMTGLTGAMHAVASTLDGGSMLLFQSSAVGTAAATNANLNNTSRINISGTYWIA